jgi:iron complex transport system substrate-binding protein
VLDYFLGGRSPSATEILYSLGLGDSIAGVTFECDFPPEAAGKSIVVNTNFAHDLTSAEIDLEVNQYSSHGESLYRVDIQKLEAIKPDLIVTQELCDVCAISTSYV